MAWSYFQKSRGLTFTDIAGKSTKTKNSLKEVAKVQYQKMAMILLGVFTVSLGVGFFIRKKISALVKLLKVTD